MERVASKDPNRFAQKLFSPLPERYDRLAELLSMGQNGRWRRAMVDHIVPDRPALVLDVASGPAGVALQLADRGAGQVVGIDLTLDMLRQGQRNVDAPVHGRPDPAGRRAGPSRCPSPTPPSTR